MLWWRLAGSGHPWQGSRPLALWSLRRLVRDVLGPVPQTWAGATLWPKVGVGRRPWGSLLGVCAAVTPRLMTRPLVVQPSAPRPARPAHSHGRISVLERVK